MTSISSFRRLIILMSKLNVFFLVLCTLYLGLSQTVAQTTYASNGSLVLDYGIFSSDEPINCSLIFDIKEFRKGKFIGDKLPAILTYHKNDSISIDKDIYIEARGVSRKTICYFPPIKLKLKKTSFDDLYFDQIKNQKLVTHCKNSKDFDQYLLKEYLVYKLYNVLSERSFKVRLMKMNYIDSENKVKPITRYAFLIEDKKVMAQRNNSILLKTETLGMKHINKTDMIQLSLFQFLIANVDWSITGLHNIKLIKSNDISQYSPYAVPYDFDYAGFVNTPYAINVLNPEISSVKIRMFVGVCYSEEDYAAISKKFISKKDDMYAIINNFELLDTKSKAEMVSFVDEFYELVEQANFYDDYILPSCKNYIK